MSIDRLLRRLLRTLVLLAAVLLALAALAVAAAGDRLRRVTRAGT